VIEFKEDEAIELNGDWKSLEWRLVFALNDESTMLTLGNAHRVDVNAAFTVRTSEHIEPDAAAFDQDVRVVGLQVTLIDQSGAINVARTLGYSLDCYGKHCGCGATTSTTDAPIDALDAVCLRYRDQLDTHATRQSQLTDLSHVSCVADECRVWRQSAISSLIVRDARLSFAPLLLNRIDIEAQQVYEQLTALIVRKRAVKLGFARKLAAPGAAVAFAAAENAVDLERVESGDLIPDPNSRLGAVRFCFFRESFHV
jgi:hypothetical protein